MEMVRCKWKYQDDEYNDYWETDCGEAWCITEGNLKDNHIVFCPFCGKKIKEVSGD